MRKRILPIAAAAILIVIISAVLWSETFLPGTQPEENARAIRKAPMCRTCHGRTPNGNADPYFSWQGGMMAQASRDPVYLAALAVANQDIPGIGEYCIRCHSPAGWFGGRSKAADGSALTKSDRHGVSCDVCHRLVDPASEMAPDLVKDVPPGYGNGMMVIDREKTVRGPYGDGPPVKIHKTIKSSFHSSGELCGTCHDVSNPTDADDIRKQKPFEYGIIERTYSEWKLSAYSEGEEARTCQSCHYPPVEGGGKAARQKKAPHRDHFVEHGPVGGSTWVQSILPLLWKEEKLNPEALAYAQKKTRAFLKTAAALKLDFPRPGKVSLRIENLTGHKLPTGYPEGRRMWINMKFLDDKGVLIKETGRYEETEDKLKDKSVKVHTLIDPEATAVYECLPGMSEAQAATYDKQAGKSFHFVLNDIIILDNRIPPKGFENKAFEARGCQPVGKQYADGQNWDSTEFDLPGGCASVRAALIYESVSWEYLKFLVEENRTNDWGDRLLKAWDQTGQCPPSEMASITEAVPAP